MKKRIWAYLLTVVMVVGLLPSVAWAANDEVTVEVTAEDESLEAAIRREMGDAYDESKIEKLSIITEEGAEIDGEDFVYMRDTLTNLTHIDMEKAICKDNKIPDIAFCDELGTQGNNWNPNGCPRIEEFVFPENLVEIGQYAFFKSGITELNLPETIKKIGNNAFGKCTSLTGTLTLPDGLEEIESNAFSGAGFTGDLIIPDSVEKIGQAAFMNCKFDGELKISNSVKELNNNTFGGTKGNIRFSGDLVIPDSVETIRNWVFTEGSFENGEWTLGKNLKEIGDSALKGICSGNTGTLIISKDYELGGAVFRDNTFDKVIFEEGRTTTGSQVVRGSTNITSVALPSTLTSISEHSFLDCSNLEETSLPMNLTRIGSYSFQNTALKGVYIPDAVNEIGLNAFKDIADGSTIYFSNLELMDLLNSDLKDIYKQRYNPDKTSLAVTNGGTFPENSIFETNVLAKPKKTGYKFLGWYENADLTGETVETPEAGKTYYAKWEKKAESGVTITPSATSMRGKGTVTLTVTATPESILSKVEVSCDGGIEVTKVADGTYSAYLPNKTQTYTFTAEYAEDDTYQAASATCTVSVTKKSSSSSSSSSASSTQTYTVSTADGMENGKVTVDLSKAEKGDKVTFTVTPDKGYEINKVTVKDADGNKIDLKEKGDGEYTFTMPDSKVEIKATFSKAEEIPVVEEVKPIILTIDQRVASVFGEPVINDVAPIIRNERTMLPIRFIAEALGGAVAWDGAQNKVTITKDDVTMEIFIGQPFALVNGAPVALDAPAFIENDRTYLPLRFVAEHLGATVTWNAEKQEVTILPNS